MTTRLFLGNLSEKCNEESLREAFSVYGEVTNVDIKNKTGPENDKKVFAFVTLSASNFNVESCIKKFCNEFFFGQRLHVTRARESFLERLQRERDQLKSKNVEKATNEDMLIKQKPITDNFNTHKRKFNDSHSFKASYMSFENSLINDKPKYTQSNSNSLNNTHEDDNKKSNSDKKRLESIKRKRQEFNEKKNIIKSGLTSIDKQPNKKVIFSDTEDDENLQKQLSYNPNELINCIAMKSKINLFDDDEESGDETNFDVKKQFEGKKGQKVLELQSQYKADSRFTLDERFVDDEENEKREDNNEAVDPEQIDEKSKQLHILQDILGVTIKTSSSDMKNKSKSKSGMLRFDPSHPDHVKFLAPVEPKLESTKKSKKKKSKQIEEEIVEEKPIVEKVEVSKEQFYKVSDSLKEAMAEPKEFSLRSLFSTTDNTTNGEREEKVNGMISMEMKEKKVRNILDPGERNPFVFDSSDSENEEEVKPVENLPEQTEPKVVWREKLFFVNNDTRLQDGLLFFTKENNIDDHKDRRELKFLMKKRIYNKERKNHMFQKKIGGRKKTVKKSFRKKS